MLVRQGRRLLAVWSKSLPVTRENPPILSLSLLHVPKGHKTKPWPHAIGTSISRKSAFFLHPDSSLSLAGATPQWLLTSCLPGRLLVAGTQRMLKEVRKGVSGRAKADQACIIFPRDSSEDREECLYLSLSLTLPGNTIPLPRAISVAPGV